MGRDASRKRSVDSLLVNLPPSIQLDAKCVDRAELLVTVPMDRKALAPLPVLHGPDASPEVRGDLLPGIESPILGVNHPCPPSDAEDMTIHENVKSPDGRRKKAQTLDCAHFRL
jgi:hypothetical protein